RASRAGLPCEYRPGLEILSQCAASNCPARRFHFFVFRITTYRMNRVGYWLSLILMIGTLSCASRKTTSSSTSQIESLAMLFQGMEQIRTDIQSHDLDAIHDEDSVISAAIVQLLSAPEASAHRTHLIVFGQYVSSLHDVSDQGDQRQAEEILAKTEKTF